MARLPILLKAQDVPKLHGSKAMNQKQRADAYDNLRPGVKIEEGQKAERFDRMQHRADNYQVSRKRRAYVGHILVPELPWLKDKNEE